MHEQKRAHTALCGKWCVESGDGATYTQLCTEQHKNPKFDLYSHVKNKHTLLCREGDTVLGKERD